MEIASENYHGHRIVLRISEPEAKLFDDAEAVARPTLFIDEEPVSYGQLPDGQYFLREFAYEWRYDLISLARSFADYRDAIAAGAAEVRPSERDSREGEGDANS
jgi:hypothetical protein